MKQHLLASAYVAPVMGITGLVVPVPLGSAALIVAVIGAVITFSCAVTLSLPLLYARARLSEWAYFLLHTAVGFILGTLFASRNAQTGDVMQLVTSASAVLINTASAAGWLYVALYVPPGRPGRWAHRSATSSGGTAHSCDRCHRVADIVRVVTGVTAIC